MHRFNANSASQAARRFSASKKIEIGKNNRPLELERCVAGEEHHRDMGLDDAWRLGASCRPSHLATQENDYVILPDRQGEILRSASLRHCNLRPPTRKWSIYIAAYDVIPSSILPENSRYIPTHRRFRFSSAPDSAFFHVSFEGRHGSSKG